MPFETESETAEPGSTTSPPPASVLITWSFCTLPDSVDDTFPTLKSASSSCLRASYCDNPVTSGTSTQSCPEKNRTVTTVPSSTSSPPSLPVHTARPSSTSSEGSSSP